MTTMSSNWACPLPRTPSISAPAAQAIAECCWPATRAALAVATKGGSAKKSPAQARNAGPPARTVRDASPTAGGAVAFLERHGNPNDYARKCTDNCPEVPPRSHVSLRGRPSQRHFGL